MNMNLSDLYNRQYRAVSGRRPKIPLSAIIYSQAPALRESKALEVERGLRDAELDEDARQFDDSMVLAGDRADIERQGVALGRENMELNRLTAEEQTKQAGKAQKISVAQTGLAGLYVANKLGWVGKAAAAKTAGTGAGAVEAGHVGGASMVPESTLAAEGAATPIAAYVAPAAAGYVGGHYGEQAATHTFGEGDAQSIGGGIVGGAAAGAAVGSIVPGVGTVIGGVIGGVVGGVFAATWYCTEVDKTVGLSETDQAVLGCFLMYSMRNHRDVVRYYLRKGPEVVRFIHQAHGADSPRVFAEMNKTLVQPTIAFMKAGEPEKAYRHYAGFGNQLFLDYTPQLVEEWTIIYRKDEPVIK